MRAVSRPFECSTLGMYREHGEAPKCVQGYLVWDMLAKRLAPPLQRRS